MKKAAFIYTSEFEKYSYPADCPFNINRAPRVRKLAESMSLFSGEHVSEVAANPAGRIELKKFHTARYLRSLRKASQGKIDVESLHMGIGTNDCPVFRDMYDYSALACGASLRGVSLILADEADVAFNPSGGFHHAGPEKAAGFCYLNDVALACITLADKGKRVLYLDIDVHHGDGVQNAFYERDDVMTISMHQSGRTLFPGTGFEDEIGQGKGKGYSVNIPLVMGTYDAAYMKIFDAVVAPLIRAYDGDVIVFELGADGLAGDPLANLQLTNNTYADIINRLLAYDKPILMTGGGGYHVGNTVRAWTLAWSVLCGEDKSHDVSMGMGGVMLESTDWQGGLRDRELPVSAQQKETVDPAVDAVIEKIQKTIFPLHGL